MKKILFFFFFFSATAHAAYALQLPSHLASSAAITSPSLTTNHLQLQTYKTRAISLIDTKIINLKQLIAQMTQNTIISLSQKTILIHKLQTTSTQLIQVKTKIATVTTLITFKTQMTNLQKIFTLNKQGEQQARFWEIAASFESLKTNIKRITDPLQKLEVQLQAEGKDTASMQSLIDDMNTKVQDAHTLLLTNTKMITDSAWNTNSATTAAQIVNNFVLVKQNFGQIHQDITTMQYLLTGSRNLDISITPQPITTGSATLSAH